MSGENERVQTAGEEIKMTHGDGKDNETVWGINELGESVFFQVEKCVFIQKAMERERDCVFVCKLKQRRLKK